MVSPSELIEATISRLYVCPVERRGDRSGRLWWPCPFHDDKNPGLCVVPGESHYHCFGCGAHGDAIDFVRRLRPGMRFLEAVEAIGGHLPRSPARPTRPSLSTAPRVKPDRPECWQDFARRIVSEAESVLWSGRGLEAQAYLRPSGLDSSRYRNPMV
jgi:CHC2 zinc finger